MGLGDPEKAPAGSSAGFADEGRWVRAANVTTPSEVRFDHGLKAEGRVERYCFTAAASGWHTEALVIDLAGDEVPPEALVRHFELAALNRGRSQPSWGPPDRTPR